MCDQKSNSLFSAAATLDQSGVRCTVDRMKLDTWRKKKGHSYRGLATLVGASHASVVRRWCQKMDHPDYRIPGPTYMLRIFEISHGEVQPNDFYLEREHD